MSEVVIGIDTVTKDRITIGDIERCGGLYILGKPRTAKSTLLVNLALQDITNRHGLLFIDPHADAINEILVRIPKYRQQDVILLDPTDETYAFSVNVLACTNPQSMKERNIAFSSAIDIFIKLFPNPQTGALDILLSKYLRNSFIPLIEHQGYSLADIPLFLKERDFRESILKQVSYNREVEYFWHTEFDRLRNRDREKEIESTLNRLNPLLTRDYVKYLVSQAKNTVDFTQWMDTRKIVLLRMPAWLDDEIKSFIGTILISQLLRAIFLRADSPRQERTLFALYCDEFHLFASPDFAKLFTQTGKFNIMPTVAHQERLGQLKPYDPNLGATLAAPLKVLFSQTVHDSDELSPEVAKDSPTEIRLERHLGISQEPFRHLLLGHKHPDIHRFMQQYLQPMQFKLEDTQADMEGERLLHRLLIDTAAVSRVDQAMARDAGVPGGSYFAMQEAQAALLQASAHARNVATLFESARGLRLSIRSLNRFLTAIMEGRIVPEAEAGDELFCHFLLAFVRQSVWVPQNAVPAFEVYISLTYGNPHVPRPIPMSLAAKYLGAKHEELYREVEAQYTRQELASIERAHRGVVEKEATKRQDHYERVLRDIMTWKHLVSRRSVGLNPSLRYPEVRAFLTPYLFAKFAPPWYYDDQSGWSTDVDAEYAADAPPEERQSREFVRQYGEGAAVVDALLGATSGYRARSTNDIPPWYKLAPYVPWDTPGYPNHLHMMELPAIAGMEPYQVWQVMRQLIELFYNLAVPDQYGGKVLTLIGPNARMPSLPFPSINLDERDDAPLLMARVETDFPDAVQLRVWWPKLTDGDIKRIGSRRDVLVQAVQGRHGRSLKWNRDDVYWRLEEYKEDKRRQSGREAQTALAQTTAGSLDLPLPDKLKRIWHRVDWHTQKYLIARACDWVSYGEVVADRTFPQPTLVGIPPEEVSASVAELIELLQEAQEQDNAEQERDWQRAKERYLKERLWKYDGLLRLQVYQAEDRVKMRYTKEWYLPARVLTAAEQKTLLEACRKELPPSTFAVLDDWVKFCQLLAQPENHVRGFTAQYVEREVNTYTTREMIDQAAQELLKLPRYTAYATLMQEQAGDQVVRKVKITTEDLPEVPPGRLPEASHIARQNAIDAGILRPRSAIEAEINKRQARWRRRAFGNPPPPAEEPPLTQARRSKPPEPEERPRKRPKNTALKAAKRPQVPRRKGRR